MSDSLLLIKAACYIDATAFLKNLISCVDWSWRADHEFAVASECDT